MRVGIYDAFDRYENLHVEALFIGKIQTSYRCFGCHSCKASHDMVTVKDRESMQVLRSQSRDVCSEPRSDR
jgi:hypothetical protein